MNQVTPGPLIQYGSVTFSVFLLLHILLKPYKQCISLKNAFRHWFDYSAFPLVG